MFMKWSLCKSKVNIKKLKLKFQLAQLIKFFMTEQEILILRFNFYLRQKSISWNPDRTELDGLTRKTELKSVFLSIKNRIYISSERTGRTEVQQEKPDEP